MKPKDKSPQPMVIPLIEDLQAPEVYVDEVSAFSIGNGVVGLTLASVRWDNSVNPPQQRRVVVGRLRLSVTAARGLATDLHGFLEKQGIPAVSAEDRKRMQ